jgi:hypothetical protein
LSENPCLSPSHTSLDPVVARAHWVTPVVVTIATIGFWLGLLLAVIGSVMSFVPGADCEWFIVAGILLALGLLIPTRRYRSAAFILCSLCFFFAYSGYLRGVEYRQWLKQRNTVSQEQL